VELQLANQHAETNTATFAVFTVDCTPDCAAIVIVGPTAFIVVIRGHPPTDGSDRQNAEKL